MEDLTGSAALLFLQIGIVLTVARTSAILLARIGQPTVVGEMIGGLILGPSILGASMPAVSAFVFSASAVSTFRTVSEIGILLFMFVAGTELDPGRLRRHTGLVVLVSGVVVIVPLVSGGALAFALYGAHAPPGVGVWPFVLFIAVAMSVTAFPVLARIIVDRGLAAHAVGHVALACAAVGDASAWCLLAIAASLASGDRIGGAVTSALWGIAFTVVVVRGLRPLVPKLIRADRPAIFVTGALMLLAASAWVTEAIGLHAIFGAFVAGIAFSRDDQLRSALQRRLNSLGFRVLVPLFFASAGLRTELPLLASPRDWATCAAILSVAVAAKLLPSAGASWWCGMSSRDALTLGALMNTRGLMELVVLGVGLDLGILTPKLYAMFVVMALVTTVMTGPLVSRLQAAKSTRAAPAFA